MINKFGILFLLILFTAPFVAIDYFWSSRFIEEFMREQSLQIMGTILALNIATASFLVGHLIDIEMKEGKVIFETTMREIKHNIYFMFVLFVLQMGVLSIGDVEFIEFDNNWKHWILGLNVILFLAYIFCLYEMTAAIFSLRKRMKVLKNI